MAATRRSHPSTELWTAGVALVVLVAMACLARGAAGDEEAMHYLIARAALTRPELFLSLVGRPLPTLLFCLPAQLGLVGARVVAVLATTLTVVAVYRLLAHVKRVPPAAATGLVLLQPFLLAHGATVMTEPISALVVALALLAWLERRPRLLVALAALAVLVRFEFLAFWPLVAFELARWRQGRLLPWLALPLLLWAGLGALVNGDPLWLAHAARARAYSEVRPFHYLLRFAWVVGPALIFPVLLGIVAALRGLRGPAPPATSQRAAAPAPLDDEGRLRAGSLLIVGAMLALYTLFGWLKPITGGNLRYLAGLAAPLALLAADGFRALRTPRRPDVLIVGGLALALLAGPWGHVVQGDAVVLHRFDPLPVAGAALILLAAWLRPGGTWVAPVAAAVVGLVGLGLDYPATLHWRMTPEQETAGLAARELQRRGLTGGALYLPHPALALALGANPYDPARCPPLTERTPLTAPTGALLFWDTHYVAGQGAALASDVFLTSPNWEFVAGFTAADSTWSTGVFRRRGGEPVAGRVRPGPEAEAWAVAARGTLLRVGFYRALAALDPGAGDTWRTLAHALLLADRPGEAVRAFDRAVALDPGDPENELFRAALATRQGRPDEALAALTRALAARPGQVVYHYQAAILLARQGRMPEARPHFLAAGAALPKRFDVQYGVGSFLFGQREWAEAERFLAAALRLEPTNGEVPLMLAEAAMQQGRFAEGEERMRELIRRRPLVPRGYLALGDYLAARGRAAEAREVWQEGARRTNDADLRARLNGAAPAPGR